MSNERLVTLIWDEEIVTGPKQGEKTTVRHPGCFMVLAEVACMKQNLSTTNSKGEPIVASNFRIEQ